MAANDDIQSSFPEMVFSTPFRLSVQFFFQTPQKVKPHSFRLSSDNQDREPGIYPINEKYNIHVHIEIPVNKPLYATLLSNTPHIYHREETFIIPRILLCVLKV